MTVATAKVSTLAYTASSSGATLSAAGTIIKRAAEAGNGSLSVVSIFQTEKTGQQYEMTLLVQ